MLPLSLLSSMKVGGSNNTISHTNYYMLLAMSLAFLAGQMKIYREKAPWIPFLGKSMLTLLLGILVLIHIPIVYYRIITWNHHYNFALDAYSHAQKYPGKTYFPRLTLIHLLAEGKLYHDIDGLMDRNWAQLPLGDEHFKKFIPGNLEEIIFYGENHKELIPLSNFSAGYFNTQALPKFLVYLKDGITPNLLSSSAETTSPSSE